jgi:hypothetical protein
MEKQKEVKINKMEIQLTDEKISLSMNEAKKLYEALAELFGKKTVEHVYHNDYWSYRPYLGYGESYVSSKSALSDQNQMVARQASFQDLNKFTVGNGVSFEAKGSSLMCDLSK